METLTKRVSELLDIDSNFMRLCVNTSRVFWREEYYYKSTDMSDIETLYRSQNKFNLYGPRLEPEQHALQQNLFVQKCFVIGYLLTECDVKDVLLYNNEQYAGTGKSLFVEALKSINNLHTINLCGRDRSLAYHPSILFVKTVKSMMSIHTRFIHIDDAADIDMCVVLKHELFPLQIKRKGEIDNFNGNAIPIVVSTNNVSGIYNSSIRRRFYAVEFSDFYNLNEFRTPEQDFHKHLFVDNYTDAERDNDKKFCEACIKFYEYYKGVINF